MTNHNPASACYEFGRLLFDDCADHVRRENPVELLLDGLSVAIMVNLSGDVHPKREIDQRDESVAVVCAHRRLKTREDEAVGIGLIVLVRPRRFSASRPSFAAIELGSR